MAPPKGSPEGDALRRAAKRVDPRGAIAKAGKADYRARSGYGTTDSDRLTDARLAARIQQDFWLDASRRSKNSPAEHDPALKHSIRSAEAVRAETA